MSQMNIPDFGKEFIKNNQTIHIQTIFSGLNTTAVHHFQHLINIVFRQFNPEENQYSQYQSEIDEYSNSYMISPYPFGLLELKENLKVNNEQYFKTQDSQLDY